MSVFAGAAVAPYLLWIKLAFLAALFLSGLFTGCEWQQGRDALALAAKDRALAAAEAQRRRIGAELRQVSTNTELEERKAQSNMQAGLELVEQAERDARVYRERMQALETELDAAKAKDPNCRKVLEAAACASIY